MVLVEHLEGISRIDTTRLLKAAQHARLKIFYDCQVCQKGCLQDLEQVNWNVVSNL